MISDLWDFVLFCFVFVLFYGHTRGMWKFPGPELNLSCSCDHSCGNNGSCQPTALGWGSNPCLHSDLSCCNQILNPLCHSENSWFIGFTCFIQVIIFDIIIKSHFQILYSNYLFLMYRSEINFVYWPDRRYFAKFTW